MLTIELVIKLGIIFTTKTVITFYSCYLLAHYTTQTIPSCDVLFANSSTYTLVKQIETVKNERKKDNTEKKLINHQRNLSTNGQIGRIWQQKQTDQPRQNDRPRKAKLKSWTAKTSHVIILHSTFHRRKINNFIKLQLKVNEPVVFGLQWTLLKRSKVCYYTKHVYMHAPMPMHLSGGGKNQSCVKRKSIVFPSCRVYSDANGAVICDWHNRVTDNRRQSDSLTVTVLAVNSLRWCVQGRLTPNYGWEINPPRLKWWSTLHLVWAEHEGTMLLFGPVWFGCPNAVVRISTILSCVLFT